MKICSMRVVVDLDKKRKEKIFDGYIFIDKEGIFEGISKERKNKQKYVTGIISEKEIYFCELFNSFSNKLSKPVIFAYKIDINSKNDNYDCLGKYKICSNSVEGIAEINIKTVDYAEELEEKTHEDIIRFKDTTNSSNKEIIEMLTTNYESKKIILEMLYDGVEFHYSPKSLVFKRKNRIFSVSIF